LELLRCEPQTRPITLLIPLDQVGHFKMKLVLEAVTTKNAEAVIPPNPTRSVQRDTN
jgi:hypothetical protein